MSAVAPKSAAAFAIFFEDATQRGQVLVDLAVQVLAWIKVERVERDWRLISGVHVDDVVPAVHGDEREDLFG